MTGVIQVATCLRSQVRIGSRGHDLTGVFLIRTATSCSVTGSNTVSAGTDLGEMVGGGATNAGNLVAEMRREVVGTKVLRLNFQRRFHNIGVL